MKTVSRKKTRSFLDFFVLVFAITLVLALSLSAFFTISQLDNAESIPSWLVHYGLPIVQPVSSGRVPTVSFGYIKTDQNNMTFTNTLTTFSCELITGNSIIINYQFSWNNTGKMENQMVVKYSHSSLKFTDTITAAVGDTISIKVNVEASDGNWYASDENYFGVVPLWMNYTLQTNEMSLGGTIWGMTKPIEICGQRYILMSDNSHLNIQAFQANEDWTRNGSAISTSTFENKDFYLRTFPVVIPNKVIILGHLPSDSGFIGFWDVQTNNWNVYPVDSCQWVLGVEFVESTNLFYIVGSYQAPHHVIYVSTPENLFSPSNWHSYALPDTAWGSSGDVTFGYLPTTELGYVFRSSAQHSAWDMFTMNLTTNTFETFSSGGNYTVDWTGFAPAHICTNGTLLFWSTLSENGNWYQYCSNGCNSTILQYSSFPMIGDWSRSYEKEDTHIPVENFVLCVSTQDTSTDGFCQWFNPVNGIAVSPRYTGIRCHVDVNQCIIGTDYTIIMDGEGSTAGGGNVADINLLTTILPSSEEPEPPPEDSPNSTNTHSPNVTMIPTTIPPYATDSSSVTSSPVTTPSSSLLSTSTPEQNESKDFGASLIWAYFLGLIAIIAIFTMLIIHKQIAKRRMSSL